MISKNELSILSASWLRAKETEEAAISARRAIEDKMASLIGIPETLDGTETFKPEGYTIKVVGRIRRTVDSDKLQELAAENGLQEHLGSLFRWKPEVNMKAWKHADDSITRPLADAITAKSGRPSFSITVTQE